MRKIISIVVCLLGVLFLVNSANADLQLLGQGTSVHGTYNLIYDTDLDITWYDYTKSGDTWQNQLDWASALSVNFGGNIYDDWRLPITVDPWYEFGYDGTTSAGFNITSSEMGHLFYVELANTGQYDTFGNETGCGYNCLTKTGYFQNLQQTWYRSSTESYEFTFSAWTFQFDTGRQDLSQKGSVPGVGSPTIAVRNGLAVVPEPISSILFITGGTLLAGRRYLRRKKIA